MTVKIEIIAANGLEAAAEIRNLAFGLLAMGQAQQQTAPPTPDKPVQETTATDDAPAPDAQPEVEKPKRTRKTAAQKKKAEAPAEPPEPKVDVTKPAPPAVQKLAEEKVVANAPKEGEKLTLENCIEKLELIGAKLGMTAAVDLIASMNVERLTKLDADRYPEFIAKADELLK